MEAALAELDAYAAELQSQLAASHRAGAGGGPATPLAIHSASSPGAEPPGGFPAPPQPPPGSAPPRAPPNAVGQAPSEFLKCMVAARGAVGGPDEFVAWWRRCVSEVALLLCKVEGGQAMRGQLIELLHHMATMYGGAALSQAWLFGLMSLNMETGVMGEPPKETWERAVRAAKLSPEQVDMFVAMNEWWRGECRRLQARPPALARGALCMLRDMGRQQAAVDGLQGVLNRYRGAASAALALCVTAILSPEQLANLYVGCYPHFPLICGMLDAITRRAGAGGGGGEGSKSAGEGGQGASGATTSGSGAAAGGSGAGGGQGVGSKGGKSGR